MTVHGLLTPRGLLLPLSALCAVLGAIVAVQLTGPADAEPKEPPVAATAEKPPVDIAALDKPPALQLDDFSEVTERPLFSETRRPAAAEAAQTAEQSGPLTLAGIVISNKSRSSLFATGTPPVITRFREGQAVNGWVIRSILRDRVVLRRGTAERDVKLHDDGAPHPAAAPPKS
ncbi:MAG TPA: hypothetical protein VHY35_24775 [Stellaceae bacterium]|jgi:type II secretory pathway component PulC|nr:hypothetical protein [Stellaceae bacterium]